MSKTVDQRVVEMRFDNKHFENNVQNSLSTLDKLKQALKLDGASKGLENVNSAAKNFNVSPMSSALDSVKLKFSALEVMGVTALANITNSAVNAGKRIISALTIEPIKTGMDEYELKMGSVQTIMASTGESLSTVNKYLEELNVYADKTIYSFSDMTSSIGKFTNSGVKLEDAVAAIKGISNEAAVSGATAEQASHAMYNFAQALSSGYVKLIDWKSIEVANMATVEFKQTLIDTAVEMGTLVKVGDKYQSTTTNAKGSVSDLFTATSMFNDSLNHQWMTTDVLVKTLGQYSDETTELGKKAYAAAQDVKTFSQLFDTLKEAAQSGWSRTWELIIGDFEEAKAFLTKLSEIFGGIIDNISTFRNGLLQGGLNLTKAWNSISEKLSNNGLVKSVEKISDTIDNATDKIEKFQSIVNKVWRGDFGTSDTGRYELLEKAGYDHRVVQDLVNKGYDYKLTIEDIEASHKKFGLTMDKTSTSTEKVTKKISDLSDEELENAGLTGEEIKIYRDLAAEAERTGVSIEELVDKMSKKDGRTLLAESLQNAWSGVVTIFNAVKKAWTEIFPPVTIVKIYGIAEAINKFSENLKVSDATAEKVTSTFKGLFAALDLIFTLTGGGLKIAFEVIKTVLDVLGVSIWDVTAYVGEAIVKFRDWLDETLDFTGAIKIIVPIISDAITAIRNWIDENIDLAAAFEAVVSTVKGAIDGFSKWIDSLKKSENLPKDIADGIVNGFGKVINFVGKVIGELGKSLVDGFKGIPSDCIAGFVNGIWEGIKVAGQVIIELGKIILEKIKDVLGIHSPSTEFAEVGEFCIEGFILGIGNAIKTVLKTVYDIGKGILESFANGLQNGNIDIGKIFAGVISGGLVLGFVKIADGIQGFGHAFDGLGDIFEGAAKVLKSFSGVLKSVSTGIKAEAIKNIAISIAILAGSVAVLSLIDTAKLWSAVGAIAALMAMMVVLIGVMGKSSKSLGDSLKGTFDVAKLTGMILGIAAALLLISIAAKQAGSMDPDAFVQGCEAVAVFAGLITILIYSTKGAGDKIDNIGNVILKISAAILLLALVAKMLGTMDPNELLQGFAFITLFAGIVVGLIAATKLVSIKDITGLGATILAIAGAIAIFAIVAKLLGSMDPTEFYQGLECIKKFGFIVAGLILATKLAGKNIAGIGATILAIAGAIAIMAGTVLLLSLLNPDDVDRGIEAIAKFSFIVAGLILATKLAGKNIAGIGATILAIAGAIAILAGVAILLSFIDPNSIDNGIEAIFKLSLIMAGLIAVTKFAQNCVGTIVTLTVAIAILTAAIIALSFVDPTALTGATIALGTLIGMFAILVAASGLAKGSLGTLIVMTVAIGVLGGVLYLLAQAPIDATLGAAAALSILMLTLTAVLAILSFIGTSAAKAIVGVVALLALCVPLLALVGILALMEGLKNAEANVIALSIFAGVLTLLLLPLSLVGALVVPALLGVASLLALCVPLVALVGILALMEGLQNAEVNVALLTSFLTTMTSILVVLAIIGPLALIGVVAMTALTALITAIGVMAVGIGALMTTFPQLEEFLNVGLPILEKLAYAIGSLVGNVLAGFVDTIANCALPELGTMLSQFMINAMPFITLIKLVDDQVLAGVGIIAASVLALTAADLIAGIASFLQGGSSFASLGTELSQFILNATPFLVGIKTIDAEAIESAKSLVNLLLTLTAANLLESITSWITGGTSLSDFAKDLVPFGQSMVAFSDVVSGAIDAEAVQAAANAGSIMAELATKIPSSGPSVVGFFMGEQDLGTFGLQLQQFGYAISAFSKAVSGENAIDPVAIEAAANAGSIMAELAGKIPSSGPSVVGFFMGEQNLGTFGTQLKQFGYAIAGFSKAVSGENAIDPTAIEAAANAGSIMAELAGKVPSSGPSVVGFFTGEQNLGTFGTQIKQFGNAIAGFSETVKDIDSNSVQTAADAGTIMTNLANSLPDSGGFLDIFTGGKTSLEDFGKQLVAFGKSIKSFSDEVQGIAVAQVSAASESATCLSELASYLPDECNNMTNFGNALPTFGENLASYYSNVGSITSNNIDISKQAATAVKEFSNTFSPDKVKSAANAISDLSKAVKSMSDIKSTAADGVTKTFDKLAKVNVTGFIEACESAYPKLKNVGTKFVDRLKDGISERSSNAIKTFKNIAENLVKVIKNQTNKMKESGNLIISKFVEGIRDKASNATRACKNVASDCKDSIRDKYTEFYYAGKYMVEGFADGIEGYAFMAESAARAMVNAAIKAAEDAADENSPSKETYRIGKFFEMGFSNAISDRLSNSYRTGYEMADYAKKGLTRAVSNIKDILESDIDTQPTIRPILDLSSVESGAGRINGMLNLTPSVGVLSNVGMINSMMNRRVQNGGSDDVVSAIRDLGKQLGNSTGDSYYIDGVTYDDGSNISNAVKSLVRAARVERRR